MTNDQIVRPRHIPNICGISKTTAWRLQKSGDFPKPIRLSAGAIGYKMSEIQAWLESRKVV